MPRESKPFYWEERRGWFARIKGKRIRLTEGGEAATKAEAMRAFYREMAAVGEGGRPRGGWTLGSMIDAWLAKADRDRLEASTRRLYLDHTNTLRRAFGDGRKPESLRPDALDAWAAEKVSSGDWSQSSARGWLAVVRRVYRWAAAEEMIESNPLKGLKLPADTARQVVLTVEQFRAVIDATEDREFRDFLTMLVETGARPSSIARLEARDIDWGAALATLQKHKTRRHTGRPIYLRFTPPALALCRELAARWPTGPLFRNTEANPWNRNTVGRRFRKLREAGLDVPRGGGSYSARHNFATQALISGVSVAATAALLGHSSTDMIDRHYSRIAERHDYLSGELAKVHAAPEPSPCPAPLDAASARLRLAEIAARAGVTAEEIVGLVRAMEEGREPGEKQDRPAAT